MTLNAIEKDNQLSEQFGHFPVTWLREKQAVTFTWSGPPGPFFKELIEIAFRVTRDGRVWLLALGNPSGQKDGGLTLQDALLGTFLQHGRTRAADPSTRPGGTLVIEIDDIERIASYRRISSYNHQKEAEKYSAATAGVVSGWLLPGGVVRHVAFSSLTEMREAPGRLLALWFAPVGVLYFRVRTRTTFARPQFSLVVPDLVDLEHYCDVRVLFLASPARDLVVSGASDAGCRAAAAMHASATTRTSAAVDSEVITFGVAPWSPQQKSRINVVHVRPLEDAALRHFERARLLLPALEYPSGTGSNSTPRQLQWETSPVLDLVAKNLNSGRSWWVGFSDIITNSEARKQFFSYEKLIRAAGPSQQGGIRSLVEHPEAFPDPAAGALVRACHEAWRRRLGALGQRARDRNESFEDLALRERERLRVTFAHCKTLATFRAALTDFWSKSGGPLPPLQNDWNAITAFFSPARWQEGRDLALLALASYRGDDREPERKSQNGGNEN